MREGVQCAIETVFAPEARLCCRLCFFDFPQPLDSNLIRIGSVKTLDIHERRGRIGVAYSKLAQCHSKGTVRAVDRKRAFENWLRPILGMPRILESVWRAPEVS